MTTTTTRLPLGQIVATPGALELLEQANDSAARYLTRHARGDWGEVSADDAALNDEALERGFRVLSAYTLSNGSRIWIITEANRSSTTILKPCEY